MKLNRSLLNKQKENLGSSTTIISNLVEDFARVINKLGSRKVSIEGINTSTAHLLQKYIEAHPEDDIACCVGTNIGLVIQGKHLIDTDKNHLYGYDPKTKNVYDDDDGELLGKLIKKNGKLKIQWDYE